MKLQLPKTMIQIQKSTLCKNSKVAVWHLLLCPCSNTKGGQTALINLVSYRDTLHLQIIDYRNTALLENEKFWKRIWIFALFSNLSAFWFPSVWILMNESYDFNSKSLLAVIFSLAFKIMCFHSCPTGKSHFWVSQSLMEGKFDLIFCNFKGKRHQQFLNMVF